jgi:hypothetical protein
LVVPGDRRRDRLGVADAGTAHDRLRDGGRAMTAACWLMIALAIVAALGQTVWIARTP